MSIMACSLASPVPDPSQTSTQTNTKGGKKRNHGDAPHVPEMDKYLGWLTSDR